MTERKGAELVFLKLGGSLLGDKRKPTSFRRSVVARLAREIKQALAEARAMRLVLAHGGGGFAHSPARRFHTREGLAGGGGWRGFAETRRGVDEIDRRVLDCFARESVWPVRIPPCAGAVAEDGKLVQWDIRVIRELLARDRIPLIHGDVVLDRRRGFTILSTEDLFLFLASRLRPARVILACDVEGVYRVSHDRVARTRVVPIIDRANLAEIQRALARPTRRAGRAGVHDVTGGMAAKVERLYELTSRARRLNARIVSGLRPDVVRRALLGGEVGTAVRS